MHWAQLHSRHLISALFYLVIETFQYWIYGKQVESACLSIFLHVWMNHEHFYNISSVIQCRTDESIHCWIAHVTWSTMKAWASDKSFLKVGDCVLIVLGRWWRNYLLFLHMCSLKNELPFPLSFPHPHLIVVLYFKNIFETFYSYVWLCHRSVAKRCITRQLSKLRIHRTVVGWVGKQHPYLDLKVKIQRQAKPGSFQP